MRTYSKIGSFLLTLIVGSTMISPALAADGDFVIRKLPNGLSEEIQIKFTQTAADLQEKSDQLQEKFEEIEAKFKTDEVIVRFEGEEKFRRVSLPIDQSFEEALRRYRSRGNIVYAEPNYIAHKFEVPNDPYYQYQWHLGSINAEEAWQSTTGAGVIVAVIDTGVAYETYKKSWRRYYQAPDLANTSFVPGYDFVENDTHPNDDEGHGTHVTGTIAQSTDNNQGVAGVAHSASIMPIKVLDRRGSGTYADIAEGIRWAADNGADVINLSLGGSSGASYLEEALAYAYAKGVTIVAAAGNSNTSSPSYPAAYDDYVISVGATRYDENRAPYSNYGPSLDLVAPGGDLGVDQNGDGYSDGVLQETFSRPYSNSFGLYFYQGTSMASPHVAGVAALVIANGITTGPDAVRAALQNTAKDLGSPGRDNTFGWGLVNALTAVQYSGGSPPPPPPEPDPEPQPDPDPPPAEEPVDDPPSVALTSPSNGATVSDSLTISANASDDNGVTKVEFYVESNLVNTDTQAPYETIWDSNTVSNGNYAITATAFDTAAQSTSDNVNITVDNSVEEPPPPPEPPPSSVVFSDSFENGQWNGLWTEDNQNRWVTSSERSTDGNNSARVNGKTVDAALTSILIDLQGATSADITFDWYLDRSVDRDEYLAFDVSSDGGTTWTERGRLRGNVDEERTWHNKSVTVSGAGNLMLRFRGTMSKSREDAFLDNVAVKTN